MKIVGILLAIIVLVVITTLSINTLAEQKVIATNPLSQVGAPTYSWNDVGQATKSIKPVQLPTNQVSDWFGSSWQAVTSQVTSLNTQTIKLNQHVQTVSGTNQLIGVAATPTPQLSASSSAQVAPVPGPTEPFYTKALDYGRYLYCQEIIKEYEQQHPEVKNAPR